MEEKQKHRIAASDFTTFLYQKGYRRNCSLTLPGTNHPGMTGTLSACLEKFLIGYRLDEKKWDKFQLSTLAPYNDNLSCIFQVQFDEVKGFLVKELTISKKVSDERRIYYLSHNQQVPGANSIEGLFPKPKPWDHIIKGKLKP